ncbi:type II toxin-antitoxin system HicB family antitoxin [bacterium]|nr:type II toxin-antitoxin system HicB family antitoxin [bacterium]
MKTRQYTVIFEPAEEGGWLAHVPALNGLTTEGETIEEATAMVQDAIQGYLEALRSANRPIPSDFVTAELSQLNMSKLNIAI